MTDNTKMREAVLKILASYKQEMERYGYYSSNPGVSVDDFEEIADEIVAWQAAQSVPVVGEPVAYLKSDVDGKVLWSEDCVCKDAVWPVPGEDSEFGEYSLPVYRKPTTSITQAELDAKDARIRELEEANASLEASYRGSCMMYDATKVELKALRKDAERYRYLRKQHWSEAEICVVTNPKDAIKLGCYCPSSVRLDSAIDSAIAGDKK